MAKPTGGISLSTNFGLNASLPLDARDLVDTKDDLLLFDKINAIKELNGNNARKNL